MYVYIGGCAIGRPARLLAYLGYVFSTRNEMSGAAPRNAMHNHMTRALRKDACDRKAHLMQMGCR